MTQIMENAIPIQFIFDNFSLKRNAPITKVKQTMVRLLMPKIKELSTPELLNALIKKNKDPKLNTPNSMPNATEFGTKNCSSFFLLKKSKSEAKNEMPNKEDVKSSISFAGINQC